LKKKIDNNLQSNNDEEEEDDEENEEKYSNFIEWNFFGISCFIYLILVKKFELNYFNDFYFFKNIFLFELIYPYIIKMMMSNFLSTMGNNIIFF
jgi:hypothetical protein